MPPLSREMATNVGKSWFRVGGVPVMVVARVQRACQPTELKVYSPVMTLGDGFARLSGRTDFTIDAAGAKSFVLPEDWGYGRAGTAVY
jgi:hypothetical protein